MLLKVVFGRPGGAIDTLQHLVLVVATPIGTSNLHQLEMLELASAGHVGATAQVFKLAFAVQGHVLVRRDAFDNLGLVVLAQTLEISHRLVARQYAARDGLIQCSQSCHLLLNSNQVFWGEGALVRKVIKETMLNHRADGDLRLGEQLLHRIRQQVGSRVANDFQAISVFASNDGQGAIGNHLEAGVHHLTVYLACQRSFGQACANGGSNFGHSNRAGKFTLGTVGKRNLNHGGNLKRVSQKSKKRGMVRALL